MVLKDGNFDELYWVVKNGDSDVVRRLLDTQEWALNSHYGNEGNLVNMAIKNASKNTPKPGCVLACLLGVEYPQSKVQGKVTLQEDKDILLSNPCDRDGMLPLMQASAVGSLECVEILLYCGADVNQETENGLRAIDYSLDQESNEITYLLLMNDSLFPRGDESSARWKRLMSIIEVAENFQELFKERDQVYRALYTNQLNQHMMDILKSGKHRYYVDQGGSSALYRAGIEAKHDAWAWLFGMGFWYGSPEEEERVNTLKAKDSVKFNQSLEEVFCKVEGCHIMKMVCKSLVFGMAEGEEAMGNRVLPSTKWVSNMQIKFN